MSEIRESRTPPAPPQRRYKFSQGSGDDNHAIELDEATKQGYQPILMAVGSDEQIVVLMENKKSSAR
jgi:hypothetical protein